MMHAEYYKNVLYDLVFIVRGAFEIYGVIDAVQNILIHESQCAVICR